ncbi:transporter [Antrihabitans sp. YC2-6]|uniref:PH-like domain-containing protein n=1 Tax=Antrihabitans sp. YC2-6 TaxID=2799498 RepID=UPI0018F773D6|nr:transporter [Antrihabitans sp. YC2-6]MBJ8345302.1 transporter [Antrihabitans sp. YC2-6]
MVNVIFVLVCIALWAALIGLMYRGWKKRAVRQESLVGELPAAPADLGDQLTEPATGLYVGSTIAPSWQNRIALHGLGFRATGEITRFEHGILLERTGSSNVWIPTESIVVVRTERGLAGKVMTADGLLVIRWTLPTGLEIDTGFRADDKTIYPIWTELKVEPSDRNPIVLNGELE